MRRPGAVAAVVLVLAALVSACTSGSSGSSSGGGPPSTTSAATGGQAPSASGATEVQGPQPAVETEANYFVEPGRPLRLKLRVYPLQRVSGHLLLSLDISLVGAEPQGNLNYFELPNNSGSGSFRGISLLDADRQLRYAVLRKGSTNGGTYASSVLLSRLQPRTWYRMGAFFPAPDASVTALDVDLQFGGLLRNVPISADATPLPGLVTDGDNAAASAGAAVGTADPGAVVTWPAPTPGADAYTDVHHVVAAVAGAPVAEGTEGVVTVDANVLFAFDSAKLTPQATSLLNRTAAVLAAKADPASPVRVVGHTDAVGGDAYNEKLSLARASAVVSGLNGSAAAKGFRLTPSGRGAKQPVAANTLPGGADNPTGRALNRRVEVLYSPKPTAPTAPTSRGTTAPSPSGADITLPPAAVRLGGNSLEMSAVVHPLVRAGHFTLVQLDLSTPVEGAEPLFSFSVNPIASMDLSRFHVIDPVTKQVYVPAHDVDDETRVLSSYMKAFNANTSYRYFFYIAALPAGATQATVDLGPLGTATGVPVG